MTRVSGRELARLAALRVWRSWLIELATQDSTRQSRVLAGFARSFAATKLAAWTCFEPKLPGLGRQFYGADKP